MKSVEERVSGFAVRGSWSDVVELGERITEALDDAGVVGDTFEEWDAWRPKMDERLDDELSAKTSRQASVDEGAGERTDVSAGEDLRRAGEKLAEASAELRDRDSAAAVDSVRESSGHAKRAADTTGRRILRTVEDAVYQDVMTRFAPYYFDNGLVSANLRRTDRFGDGGEFVFEVDVDDDELKETVGDILSEHEEEVERWHVETPKDTSSLEAAADTEITG